MKISIIHPSRSRPKQAGVTLTKWLISADNPQNIEYIFSLDLDDPMRKQYKGQKIIANNNTSAIAAINYAAHYATGDLLIVVSDDFDCLPHWDTVLLSALKGKVDFLVKTPDGIQPTLITLPIMDRTYYNRFGYIYYPGYQHMWSDQEMTAVGMMLGRVINVNLLFEHKHYSTGKFKKDAISKRNDSTWNQGKQLFHERLKSNFGIEQPVMAYGEIKWK
jgi:hypothetical protein